MLSPRRVVLVGVLTFAAVVCLVHLFVAWFSSADFVELVEASTAGQWFYLAILACLLLIELRTDLFAMRVAAVVLLLGQSALGAFDWLQLRSNIEVTGASPLQAAWLVALPISLALILHAERPIISWQWKEPRTSGTSRA